MKIYVGKDYAEMSRIAANVISAQVMLKPACTLGLATGSTPIGMYQVLAERCANGELDFSAVKSINLDEYVGLSPEHDQSYRYFMNTNLFDHINIDKANTNVPNGLAADPDAECARYDAVIDALGPIDVQVLGMGHNGHIGFNEPSDVFELGTHKVDLAESTIEANARFFSSANEVPRQALTMGIRAIMQAKTVLVVVSGKGKAEIVKKAFTGPVTPQCPASILQMHPDVILVGDEEALSLL
ncbi:MAG: glucosamine-6-phosphate deaminase [Oscillospiraceae bacterium]|nr:glucosamine-6-phosphate deaminase [Oscillospiraceae bacterium]